MSGKTHAMWVAIERHVDDRVLAGADPVVLLPPGTARPHRVGCPIREDRRLPSGVLYVLDQQQMEQLGGDAPK
jgi:hypothetical protein